MKRLAIRAARAAAAFVCGGIAFARWVCFTQKSAFPWAASGTALGASRAQLAGSWGGPVRSTSEAFAEVTDEAWNFTAGPWQFHVFFRDQAAVLILAFRNSAMPRVERTAALAAMGGPGWKLAAKGIWKRPAGETAIQLSDKSMRFAAAGFVNA